MRNIITIAKMLPLFLGFAVSAQAETLRVASEGAYPPFNFVDSKNELHGFDIDIAKEICNRLKADCLFTTQDWDGSIPALLAKKFDILASSVTVTKERQQRVLFTDRYFETKLMLAVPVDSDLKDASPASLNGRILGAASSTAQGIAAEDIYGVEGAQVKLYPNQDEVNRDLANGRLDAIVHEKFPLADWIKNDSGSCCKLLGEVPNSESDIAFAVRKEDTALQGRMNKALADMKSDGTYQRIVASYFPSEETK